MTAAVVDVAVLDALIDVLVGEASLVVVDAAAVEAFADDDVVSSSLPAEHPAKTSTAPATHITVDQRRAAPPSKVLNTKHEARRWQLPENIPGPELTAATPSPVSNGSIVFWA
ncbi:hypothetical protein GS894_24220 [Rhodococcus hoagii]|nr:hypothetical protein [Prescottella equi]NKS05199.1 hypothetical protein [Prescottella equi]NKS05230.1 hypothetical protein [Prescottella equi]NKS92679.1 hypothetical protein [Prescottella equi]NKT12091.1 hypothetical protein [Prescottella equi]